METARNEELSDRRFSSSADRSSVRTSNTRGFVKDFSLPPFLPPSFLLLSFSQETKVSHAASKVSETAKVEKEEGRKREKGRIFLSFRRKKKKRKKEKKEKIANKRAKARGEKGGGGRKRKRKKGYRGGGIVPVHNVPRKSH